MQAPSASVWVEARDELSREEVYRFRYAHYFSSREYLPGTDHAGGRVWLPHDDRSRHFLARVDDGVIAAVATATPATEPSLWQEWRDILELHRLRGILPQTTIISRAIVAERERNSALFGKICLRLAALFLEEGFHYAVHYCAPGMVPMYERLGYRLYGHGRNLRSGPYRLPMFLVADDIAYFRRLRSPFRTLGRDAKANRPWKEKAFAVCPELAQDPFCLLSDAGAAAKVLDICPGLRDRLTPSLLHVLRRGSLFSLRKGDILAPAGIDEGTFLVLSGCLEGEDSKHPPGSIVKTGSCPVLAKEDVQLVCVSFKEKCHDVECPC